MAVMRGRSVARDIFGHWTLCSCATIVEAPHDSSSTNVRALVSYRWPANSAHGSLNGRERPKYPLCAAYHYCAAQARELGHYCGAAVTATLSRRRVWSES